MSYLCYVLVSNGDILRRSCLTSSLSMAAYSHVQVYIAAATRVTSYLKDSSGGLLPRSCRNYLQVSSSGSMPRSCRKYLQVSSSGLLPRSCRKYLQVSSVAVCHVHVVNTSRFPEVAYCYVHVVNTSRFPVWQYATFTPLPPGFQLWLTATFMSYL